ncbi:MAG: hypothetical protein WA021_03715 [Minisyncoccia bacterium]
MRSTPATTFALTVAGVLIAYGLPSAPEVANTISATASAVVGVTAAVGENPDNALAEALRAKEDELAARERNLDARTPSPRESDPLAMYSLILGSVLFALVAVNFFFDFRRRRTPSGTISLRT